MNDNARTVLDKKDRPVFAAANMPDGIPIMLVGIPEKAWKHIRNGRTVNFDLTGHGVKVRLMVFGAPNQFRALKTLQEACTAKGIAYLDERRHDFGIKDVTGQSTTDMPDNTTDVDPKSMSREEIETALHSARSMIRNMEATLLERDDQEHDEKTPQFKPADSREHVERCTTALVNRSYDEAVDAARAEGRITPVSREQFARNSAPTARAMVMVVLRALEPDA